MMGRAPGASRDGWIAAGCAAGVHLGLALIAILAGITGTSEWFDQRDYHLPVIFEFARTLPTPTVSDYNSATTPGYHLLMAVAVRAGVEGVLLSVVNALFGVVFVAMVAGYIGRLSGVLVGIAAGCLLGVSPYVLSSSVWMTTDNLASIALFGAFLAAAPIAAARTPYAVRCGVLASLVAVLGVCVRQILAYAAAFPGAAVVARACAERRAPRASELAVAALALLPSLIVVAIFVKLWGGLVPPTFQQYHGGGANPVTPIYVLAVVAVWATPVFIGIPGFLRELFSPRMMLLAALAAIVACALPSSYVVHVRFGGILWTVASKLPAPFERSILIVPLAGLGAAVLGAYLRLWSRTTAHESRGLGLYALLALLGMTVAQTTNTQCFERYIQPPVLVLALVAAASLAGPRLRAWPFLAMTAVALVLSLFNVYRIGAN
ncbi:MAG: hypothetical protein RL591_2160 [Planctomycetota bacterium]